MSFPENLNFQKKFKKNDFPNFCSFLKSPWDLGDGDGDGDGDCDRHGEF